MLVTVDGIQSAVLSAAEQSIPLAKREQRGVTWTTMTVESIRLPQLHSVRTSRTTTTKSSHMIFPLMHDELMALVAARKGHFKMESGYHAERWFELDSLWDQRARLAP